jgi:hypothetical protein
MNLKRKRFRFMKSIFDDCKLNISKIEFYFYE